MSFARQANVSRQRLVAYLSRLAHCLIACANACSDLAHGNQVVNVVLWCRCAKLSHDVIRRSTSEATQAIAEARKAGRDTMQTLTSSRCAFSQGIVLRRARAEPARRAAVSQCVVARASTNASDFRRLTLEEIDQQVEEAKRSLLLDFRVKQVRSQVCRVT